MKKIILYSLLTISILFASIISVYANEYIDPNTLMSSDDFKSTENFYSSYPYVNKSQIKLKGTYSKSNLIKISAIYTVYNSTEPYYQSTTDSECILNLTNSDDWTCNLEFKKSETLYSIMMYDIENGGNEYITSKSVLFDNEPYSGYTLIQDSFHNEIMWDGSIYMSLITDVKFDSIKGPIINGFVRGYYNGVEVCKGANYLHSKYADHRADNEMQSFCKFEYLDFYCVNYPYLDLTLDDGFGNMLPTTRVYFPSYTNPLDTPLCKYPPQKDALYRFWSDKNKSHFYTSSLSERNSVIDWRSDEWKYEGVAYTTPSCSIEGVSTVYRFWSNLNKKHFYTNSIEERNHVINAYDDNEWLYEGEAFCAYNGGGEDKMPVYRFWSNMYKGHFYTSSEDEKNEILRKYSTNEWKLEGVAYYVSK